MAMFYKELLSKIETTEQIDRAIFETSVTLYGLAVFFLLDNVIFLRHMYALYDVAITTVTGFLLRKSRSRSVALLIVAYAATVTTQTALDYAGLTGHGGTNVWLGLFVTVTAYRGVYATFMYHKRRATKADVKGVMVLSVVATFLSVILANVLRAIAWILGYNVGVFGDWLMAGILLIWLLVFNRLVPFTHRFRVVKPATS